MDMHSLLFKMGIGTWALDIITALPSTPTTTFQIGKNLPTNIGFIYGMSTYADGTDPDGNTLISTTQAQNIYMTLQNGSTQFFEQIRMDDLLNVYAGSPIVRADKYMPVNIPVFDLSKSFYQNPNSYVNSVIRLKIWYIQLNDWQVIKNHFTFDPQHPQVKTHKH